MIEEDRELERPVTLVDVFRRHPIWKYRLDKICRGHAVIKKRDRTKEYQKRINDKLKN